jgi:hypothetical protein
LAQKTFEKTALWAFIRFFPIFFFIFIISDDHLRRIDRQLNEELVSLGVDEELGVEQRFQPDELDRFGRNLGPML